MKTFDISRGAAARPRRCTATRPFARSCLLARRLVEDGVRFVTVYYTSGDNQPWDTHADHDERHRKLCADSDRATAALIADLKQRGMLDDTLVDLGRRVRPHALRREPRQGQGRPRPPPHRLLDAAGRRRRQGRLRLRRVRRARHERRRKPVHVHDLHATILHLCGLDHEKLTYRYAGRDFRLTDVYGEVVRGILA